MTELYYWEQGNVQGTHNREDGPPVGLVVIVLRHYDLGGSLFIIIENVNRYFYMVFTSPADGSVSLSNL